MNYDHQGAKEADVPGTACLIKCSSNHTSNNSEDPAIVTKAIYLVPGTSFLVYAWLIYLASKIIMGVIVWPIALTQPTTAT